MSRRHHRYRGCVARVKQRICKNDRTMANCLMSSSELKTFDQVRGIHGAMKERAGAKKATNAARRRHDKKVITDELSEE